ncbi:hypothetical protein PsAD46_00167 [Pseudovibrio sp. Ad46]|nr:hypothetical protein PsAD46_00167 [Pseudovibrio sp. Ad46]
MPSAFLIDPWKQAAGDLLSIGCVTFAVAGEGFFFSSHQRQEAEDDERDCEEGEEF